jgi:hypothetical protein
MGRKVTPMTLYVPCAPYDPVTHVERGRGVTLEGSRDPPLFLIDSKVLSKEGHRGHLSDGFIL